MVARNPSYRRREVVLESLWCFMVDARCIGRFRPEHERGVLDGFFLALHHFALFQKEQHLQVDLADDAVRVGDQNPLAVLIDIYLDVSELRQLMQAGVQHIVGKTRRERDNVCGFHEAIITHHGVSVKMNCVTVVRYQILSYISESEGLRRYKLLGAFDLPP